MTRPSPDSPVTLREITAANVRTICDLSVHPHQRRFVAPNGTSIAEGSYSPIAWFRAIYAGETPIGFAMLECPPPPAPLYLWRFMIDGRYQALGFGRRALDLILDHARTLPNTIIETSVVQGDGTPQPFYERAGFALTGAIEEGEPVLRRAL